LCAIKKTHPLKIYKSLLCKIFLLPSTIHFQEQSILINKNILDAIYESSQKTSKFKKVSFGDIPILSNFALIGRTFLFPKASILVCTYKKQIFSSFLIVIIYNTLICLDHFSLFLS